MWRRLSPDSDEMPFSCYNYTLLLAGLLLILILVTEHRVPPPPSPLALPPPPQYIPQPTLKANAYTNETHTKKHGKIIIGGQGQEKDSRLPLCWTYEPARLLAQLWP